MRPLQPKSAASIGSVLVSCGLLLCACHSGDRLTGSRASTTSSRGTAKLGGRVISTVNGNPIVVDEVQELVSARLSPREALRRLEAERLLTAEAERRGLASNEAVHQVSRQALVQALLVSEAAATVSTDAEIRQAYEKERTRFERPERRASVHVLAKLPKKASLEADSAAKALAERMLGELAAAKDPAAFVASHNGRVVDGVIVVAEQLPAFDKEGGLVKPYLDALFSVAKPGVVAAPVRTSYGWHAIRVTQIIAADTVPYDKAVETLRPELLLRQKRQRVQQLIEQLRTRYAVQISPDVDQTLARIEH